MTFRSNMAAVAALDAQARQEREFAFSDADFQVLSQLAYETAGIVLSHSKRNLVYSRLSRRLRALNLNSFSAYRVRLTETPQELENFINAISTNLTKFFRESHHFDHLRTNVAIPFAASRRTGRLRIWSAGCSTGEEPYTIAAVLKRETPDAERQDIRILATDIDTDVLKKASEGRYPAASLDDVPTAYRETMLGAACGSNIELRAPLRDLIRFRSLNLLKPWPFGGPFDAIFCRNVMIYFDGPTKTALVDRFVDKLKPNGWLYIGHSESILGTHPRLQLVGRTTYRRIG